MNGIKRIASSSSTVERSSRKSGLTPYVAPNPTSSPLDIFSVDLVREKILKYAIHKEDGSDVDLWIAHSVRLVAKCWNASVIRLLHQSHEPLYRITPTWKANEGEQLEKFSRVFGGYYNLSANTGDVMPPFSLQVRHPNIFWLEFQQSLATLYKNCGSGLVKLELPISPLEGFSLPSCPLTRLHKLDLNVGLGRPDARGGSAAPLIQSVLSDAKSLVELNVTFRTTYRLVVPESSILESVLLPPSVSKIAIVGELRSQELEILAVKTNPLPNLTSLTLTIRNVPFRPGILYEILDKCNTTLKILSLERDAVKYQPPHNPTEITLPLMSKLEKFSSDSIKAQLEPSKKFLETCLPKLRILHLRYQTDGMLRKWSKSKFALVSELSVGLANEAYPEWTGRFRHSLDLEMMRRLHMSFPNVRKLELWFSAGMGGRVLRYVFGEMRELTHLKITVFGPRGGGNKNFWDSRLTGIPIEIIARSRYSGEAFWEENEAKGRNPWSISNLKELESLSLQEMPEAKVIFLEDGPHYCSMPFISDLAFQFALLEMPKLKHLTLQGRFRASDEMTREWRKSCQGRTIVNDSARIGY